MMDTDRRSVMALGIAATAAIPFLASPALAQEPPAYGPHDGKDIGPGRRLVEVGTMPSEISAYKEIKIIDVVYQPGADDGKESEMDMDMVCHITAGEFDITKRGKTFHIKTGGVYTCGKGKTDFAKNTSNAVGIHRIALLVPA